MKQLKDRYIDEITARRLTFIVFDIKNLSLGPGPVIGATARRRNLSLGPGPSDR